MPHVRFPRIRRVRGARVRCRHRPVPAVATSSIQSVIITSSRLMCASLRGSTVAADCKSRKIQRRFLKGFCSARQWRVCAPLSVKIWSKVKAKKGRRRKTPCGFLPQLSSNTIKIASVTFTDTPSATERYVFKSPVVTAAETPTDPSQSAASLLLRASSLR